MNDGEARINRIKNNKQKEQDADIRITKAKIDYESIIKKEQNNKLVLHTDNVNLYSSKRLRRNLIKRAKKQGYPPEELSAVQKISDRDPFNVNTVSESDIQRFLNMDIFIQDKKQLENNYHQRNFFEKLVFGGDENDS